MDALSKARKYDLHLHSTRSDGACRPDEVVQRGIEAGLDVIALTDHDLTCDGQVGVHTDGGRSLRVLGGAEISGVHKGKEYHLLVYFPHAVPDGFRQFCIDRARERAQRYQNAVDSLGLDGVPDADDAAREGQRSLTRHHLARALVSAGHAHDLRDAFDRYADTTHGHVRTVSLPFVDAIRVAREAGGVTSWAHPPVSALQEHIGDFVAAGLQGLEGLRPMMSPKSRKLVRKLAKQHGLFLTGGSDWHGWHDGRLGLFHVERVDLAGFLAALDRAA